MTAKDDHSIYNDLLTRYLSGELSPAEQDRFRAALEADPSLKLRLEEFRKLWDSMDGLVQQHSYDMDSEWDQMRAKIPGFESGLDTGSVETEKEKAKVIRMDEPEKRESRPVRTLGSYVMRIAAVLVVGLLLSLTYLYTTRIAGTEKVVAGATPLEWELQDGTQVVLNRYSGIRFPKDFDKDGRKIRLEGEAWFQVARDTLRPFTIDAGPAVVEVLGTSFNVNAYRENTVVEITVESGIVSLTGKQDESEQIVLRAGNSGTYDPGLKELVLVPQSNPNNLSWKTRELYFEDTELQEVAGLIAKVYDVEILIPDQELRACPITVTFQDQSLEAVLRVLSLTLDLEVSRTDGGIILEGEGCGE